MNVSAWKPGTTATVGGKVLGFPFDAMQHMPAGDYYVQALLNVSGEYHRADGHTMRVHADYWQGQHRATSPGNLVSDVVKVHFDPYQDALLTELVPELERRAADSTPRLPRRGVVSLSGPGRVPT